MTRKAAQKKSNPNLNNAGATPAPEPEAPQEAPTPATPITPGNPANFAKNQNVNAAAQVPNGQPAAPAPPPQAAPIPAPPSHADPSQGGNFLDPGTMVRTVLTLFRSAFGLADMSIGFQPRFHKPHAVRKCLDRLRFRFVLAGRHRRRGWRL